MPRIAIVTCQVLPEPDPDEALLLAACRESGLDAEMAAWDDPAVRWDAYDLAVVRSTWDYIDHVERFRGWIEAAASQVPLLNPAPMLLENLDKVYLADLESRGIPTVPTRFLAPGQDLGEVLREAGWAEFVLKPTVSAGSYLTERFTLDDLPQAQALLATIERTHRAMVQPYLRSVEQGGEIALVHVDGALTHGVVKTPRFHGNDESVSAAVAPDASQQKAAERVMQTIAGDWLYARVDLMASDDGRWLLSELELIEPSLFFLQCPDALARFVSALKRRVGNRGLGA